MDATQISQNDVDGFRENLNLAPQQEDVIYVNAVDSDLAHAGPGKLFNADEVGQSDPTDDDAIVPDSPEGIVSQTRRVGAFKGFRDGKFIDSVQKVQQLKDPTNEIMMSMRAGKHRKMDARIRTGFFEPVRWGETGENTKNFPSANYIAADSKKFQHQDETVPASGAFGLSIGKLLQARAMLTKGKVKGKRYIACTSDDISEMLSRTPVTSADYATMRRLENGEINSFMGFTFLIDDELGTDPSDATLRILPCFVDRAMIYKARTIEEATITKRADKSMTPYAFYRMQHGVCRRYDEGVVGIRVKIPT